VVSFLFSQVFSLAAFSPQQLAIAKATAASKIKDSLFIFQEIIV
jgi:hypothetical protein